MLRSVATVARVGAKVAGAGLAGGAGYGLYLYETDEGYERAMKAYATMVPVVLNYRLLEAKEKYLSLETSEEEWKMLDEFYAQRTVKKLGEMQGVYVKCVGTQSLQKLIHGQPKANSLSKCFSCHTTL